MIMCVHATEGNARYWRLISGYEVYKLDIIYPEFPMLQYSQRRKYPG
jgi:hypothetical protein